MHQQLDLLTDSPDESKMPLTVRVSGRARNMTINVAPHRGVEVVVPKRTSSNEVERFISKHRDWIDKTQAQLNASVEAPVKILPESVFLKAIDKHVRVEYQVICGKRGWRYLGKDAIGIACARKDFTTGRDILKRWLQHEGKRWLVPWLQDVSDETGLKFKRAQVRGQKTRWGSYSSSGTLSLNYYLMLLDAELVRYLFVHELSHTIHMNHSRSFWSLVKSHDPTYKVKERRLNDTRALLPAWLLQY